MRKGRRGVDLFVPTSHKLGGVCAAQRSSSRRRRRSGRIQHPPRVGGAYITACPSPQEEPLATRLRPQISLKTASLI
jgi:hypothetical protein